MRRMTVIAALLEYLNACQEVIVYMITVKVNVHTTHQKGKNANRLEWRLRQAIKNKNRNI